MDGNLTRESTALPRHFVFFALLVLVATVQLRAEKPPVPGVLPQAPAPQSGPWRGQAETPEHAPTPLPRSTATVFSHPDDTRWYIAGQANFIGQAHPNFHSPYEATNSFHAGGEEK